MALSKPKYALWPDVIQEQLQVFTLLIATQRVAKILVALGTWLFVDVVLNISMLQRLLEILKVECVKMHR